MNKSRNKTKFKEKLFKKPDKLINWKVLAMVGFLVLILIIFFIVIKVNFLAKNELYLELKPLQNVISTDYEKSIDFNFTIKNHNFWFCKTYCDLTLYDPYEQTSLFFENITLKSNSEISKTYEISLKTRGEGQRLYYFEAECNNIRSPFCQTDEKKIYKSSFVAINFRLPESESELRADLIDKLNAYSEKIDNALSLVEENELILSDINTVKPIFFENERTKINTSLLLLNKIQMLWKQDEYNEINERFSNENIAFLDKLINELQQTKDESLKNILVYNFDIAVFKTFQSKWDKFNDAFRFYLQLNNSALANNVEDFSEKINADLYFFNTIPFINLSDLDQSLSNHNVSFFKTIKKFESDNEIFQKTIEDNIKTHLAVQSRIFNILNINKTETGNSSCENLKLLTENYKQININAKDKLDLFGKFKNNSEFVILRNSFKKSIVEKNFTIAFNNLSNQYIINNSVIINNTQNLTAKDYVSILQFNDIHDLENITRSSCKKINQNLLFNLSQYSFNKINITSFYKKEVLNISFKNNSQKCCIFKSCSDCIINGSLYPTIFIHGHSVLEKNPVEESLISFSKIQKKMGEEGKFINVGDIDYKTAAFNEKWSMMNYPIAVKASYYYITYYDLGLYSAASRKSESIESYAIRLKELIDIVKLKTGAAKVNIAAHSMGGLVAREYIVLFGEQNIDKLIMIGTPNKGISGKINDFCSPLGSDKECSDMAKDSIFLRKLNDKNIPKNTRFFVIYGTGCNTDGKDGDGTIAAQDAILDYSENYEIKGKCDNLLGTGLHNDMLDPDKYPNVYNKIIEILNR